MHFSQNWDELFFWNKIFLAHPGRIILTTEYWEQNEYSNYFFHSAKLINHLIPEERIKSRCLYFYHYFCENFKNANFALCKEGFKFTVKNAHECNLGKWLDLNEDKHFAKSKEWVDLKNAHKKVHELVQTTVDLYCDKSENDKIFATTKEVEENIEIVFDLLNKIREINCDRN